MEDGLLLWRVEGNYVQPPGFLYSYYVALVFALAGSGWGAVYLVQAVLLGVSVGLVYAVFCPGAGPRLRALLLAGLLAFAYLDVFKHYTFRLLSKNLALVLVALFFYQLKGWLGRAGPARAAAALCGATLGPALLTRPNLVFFALLLVVLALGAGAAQKGAPGADLVRGGHGGGIVAVGRAQPAGGGHRPFPAHRQRLFHLHGRAERPFH